MVDELEPIDCTCAVILEDGTMECCDDGHENLFFRIFGLGEKADRILGENFYRKNCILRLWKKKGEIEWCLREQFPNVTRKQYEKLCDLLEHDLLNDLYFDNIFEENFEEPSFYDNVRKQFDIEGKNVFYE